MSIGNKFNTHIQPGAGGAASDVPVRFLFFLPPPAGALAGSSGVGALCMIFGVVPWDELGPGVAEERRCVAGVSAGAFSALIAKALEARDIFECAAVARMAFRRSMLFCCRFGAPGELGTFRFNEAIEDIPSSGFMASSAAVRFFVVSAEREGSVIGHTKPVLGV